MFTTIRVRTIHFLKNAVLFLALNSLSVALYASEFQVHEVKITGLHHISRETVLHYLPIQIGQSLTASQSSTLIKHLYATGFFQKIALSQEANNCLKISIEEKPIIKEVVITGHRSLFSNERLNPLLKTHQLVQGGFLDESSLQALKTELISQYSRQGYYSAKIEFSTQPEKDHHIILTLHFVEGSPVKVNNIQILGQKSFRESQLLSVLPLSRYRIWSFLTGTGRYNLAIQKASLEALHNFYLDNGFFDFKIDTNQVNLTPDRRTAYWTIQITEGSVYTVDDFKVQGNSGLAISELQKLIKVFPQQRYSRSRIIETEHAIKDALGAQGYLNAQVSTKPIADAQAKTIRLIMNITPGKRFYVRNIQITGNIKTADHVLRRLLRQYEASVVSLPAIRDSMRQLLISGFIQNTPEVTPVPVPEIEDQIDLNIHVKEQSAFNLTFGLGYGNNGFSLSSSLNQPNILGTGNRLSVNFDRSTTQNVYNLGYETPYYTLDGVGRSTRVYYIQHKPDKTGIRNYLINTYGGEVQYRFPLNEQGDTLQVGGGLQHMDIALPDKEKQSEEVKYFVDQYGTHFNQAIFTLAWQRNSFDRLIFPTHGIKQEIGANFHFAMGDKNPLNYYKASYEGIFYFPLQPLQKVETPEWILKGRLNLGYGDGFTRSGLPFFTNYHAGGLYANGQVRGFEENSVGPKDSTGSSLGGNILCATNLSLIFPHPLQSKQIRTSVFLDMGNVYSNMGITKPNHPKGGTDPGMLRASVGFSIDCFISVMNMTVNLNFSKALNPHPDDKLDSIQLGINASF